MAGLVDEEGHVWVRVGPFRTLWMKWGDSGFIGIENGRLLISYRPSTERELVAMHLKVKRVLRSDPVTIRIYSGFWSHRWITLTFDTREGADKVEPELLKIVSK